MKITLCGSAKFEKWFKFWNEELTLLGHVVYSLAVYKSDKQGEQLWYTEEQKAMLDKVHKLKIDHSDAILVLNPFAYIGSSTMSEISHARQTDKQLFFLESWGANCGLWSLERSEDQYAHALSYGVPEGFVSPMSTCNYFQVWDLLGPAGAYRSALVERIHGLK